MGEFEYSLLQAKGNSQPDFEKLTLLYKSMLEKYATIDGKLDEDLLQELKIVLVTVIRLFDI